MVTAIGMAVAAAAAGVAWLYAAWRSQHRVPGLITATVAAGGGCWALACAAVRLVEPDGSLLSGQLANFLMVVAAGGLLTAVAGSADRVVPMRRPGIGVSEAAAMAFSVATVTWVAVDAPILLPASAAFALLPAVLDLIALLVVLRLPARTPYEASLPSRGVLVGALTAVLAADLLRGTRIAGADNPRWPDVSDQVLVPVVLASCALLVLYNLRLADAAPASGPDRTAEPADDVRFLPRRRGRLVPYGVALAAPAAVGLQALVTGTGTIPVFGLGCLAVAFAVWQTLLLLEQDELLRRQVQARKRLSALVENASDLLLRLDTNGRVLAVNAAAPRLLHRQPASITQRPFEELARPEDQRKVREAVLEVTRGHRDEAEIEVRLAPPAAGTAQLRLRSVDGGAVANLNDVTDSVELRQRLERLARFDQMTGLANRGHLLDEVGTWLASRRDRADGPDGADGPEPRRNGVGAGIAVLYADLDGFKAVNDRFGHAAGDRVLVEVAARLDAVAGGVDARRVIIARVGGDEFILALEGVGAAAAATAAQRLVESIHPPFRVGGRTVRLGVSVGVAYTDVDDEDHLGRVPRDERDGAAEHPAGTRSSAATLVHRADLAMYAAKADGRARSELWRPELEEQVRRRVDLAIGLRDALERGRLSVAYQPIVRLSDGHVQGVEALLRLPTGVERVPGLDDLVSPAELVEVAEDTGAITELGEWVLRQAVTQAAGWARRGYGLSVSVNMSVAQLVSPAFVDLVTGMLDATGLPPTQLVLELTESQLLEHSGPAPQTLQALHEAGIRLAVDDFGTGYSSLSYLRRMPVSLVKIDRSLLAGLGTDPRAAALLSAVVAMARGLDLSVVAEGMEDLATARALRDLGVQAGQGFGLSKALPAAELRQLLQRGPILIDEPENPGEPGENSEPGGPADPGVPPVTEERSSRLNP